jgi:hypothetical protein
MAYAATVFGLDVICEQPMAFLESARARPTGRTLELAIASTGGRDVLQWPDSAETVCDQRERNGNVIFRIEAHPEDGYLIWGPTCGSHLLSPDGRRGVCAPDSSPERAWQRLLVAQVLPFAAVLNGLEVFHAGAVVKDGGAVLLMGPSGAGKTSLALALCARGAVFLADDVVAVEQIENELLCHPGAPVAGVEHGEAQRLQEAANHSAQDHDHEVLAVNGRERLVRMGGAAAPAPLRAVFVLDRRAGASREPHFETILHSQPLLASTFNTVLTPAARLRSLLDICALAARRQVERVTVGSDVDATQLAAAIEQRLEAAP